MVPISCRIFYVETPNDLNIIYDKLNNRILKSESQLIDGLSYELTTKFFDVALFHDRLVCKLRYQDLIYSYDIDMKLKPTINTYEADLDFRVKSKTFVLVHPSEYAGKTVKYLRYALETETVRPAIYKYILPKYKIDEIMARNPGTIKTSHYKGMDLPGWDSLIIHGDDLTRSQEMVDFMRQHSIDGEGYIIWTLFENGWTIGITREGSAVCWKSLEFHQWADFVAERFL